MCIVLYAHRAHDSYELHRLAFSKVDHTDAGCWILSGEFMKSNIHLVHIRGLPAFTELYADCTGSVQHRSALPASATHTRRLRCTVLPTVNTAVAPETNACAFGRLSDVGAEFGVESMCYSCRFELFVSTSSDEW